MHRASLVGYGVFVNYKQGKGASRGSAREPEDPHRSTGRSPPSRAGHSTQGHGAELRRHSFDPRVGPSSRPDDTPAHPYPRGRVQRGVGGRADVRRRRRDRGRPDRLLRAQAAGVPHALCNTGTERVWVMEVLTPGGFEGFFDEYEEIAAKLALGEISEDEHRRARAELSEGYGLVWHDERIPEARARFGIGP